MTAPELRRRDLLTAAAVLPVAVAVVPAAFAQASEVCTALGTPGHLTDQGRADVMAAILREGAIAYNREIARPKGLTLLKTDMSLKENTDAAFKILPTVDDKIVPSLDRFYDLCAPRTFDFEVGTLMMAKAVSLAVNTDKYVLSNGPTKFSFKMDTSDFIRQTSMLTIPPVGLTR